MILSYYVDVSGKETTRGERAITAAGYLGGEVDWSRFERAWRATLSMAKSDYFHATEFFACAGPFEWLKRDPALHRELATLFALTTYTMLPWGFSSSLDLDHFDPIFVAACKGLRTPHDRIPAAMIAVAEVCSQAAHRVLPPGGPQAKVFIEEGDGVGEVLQWLRHLKKIGEGWTGAFVGFEPVSGREYQVQAADFLAHESWREATAMMRDPHRKWEDARETFRLLATGASMSHDQAKVEIRYATDEHFQKSAPLLATFIASHPEYQTPPRARGLRIFRQRFERLIRKWRVRTVGRWKRMWFGTLRIGGRAKRRARRARKREG